MASSVEKAAEPVHRPVQPQLECCSVDRLGLSAELFHRFYKDWT